MNKHTFLLLLPCLLFLSTLLYNKSLLQNLWTMSENHPTEGHIGESESHIGCPRYRRSLWEQICPQYYRVSFNSTTIPGHKIELMCDSTKTGRCRGKCKQKLNTPDNPKLILLGMKMIGDTPTYYFKEFIENENASCLCE